MLKLRKSYVSNSISLSAPKQARNNFDTYIATVQEYCNPARVVLKVQVCVKLNGDSRILISIDFDYRLTIDGPEARVPIGAIKSSNSTIYTIIKQYNYIYPLSWRLQKRRNIRH